MGRFLRTTFQTSLVVLSTLILASCGASTAQQESPGAETAPTAVDCSMEKCVALTFDDGPGQFTDRLLDELKSEQAVATFFVLGKNVGKYPQSLERMVAEGHQIGSHTYDHKDITKLTAEGIEHEVQWTEDAIFEAAGVKPEILRPPYGAHGVVYDRLIPYPLVLWDVDTLDWKHHDPVKTVSIALDEVQSGSIILMHDIHESSVQAVPDLVAKLRAEGYTLVTIDQLFAGSEFESSKTYDRLKLSSTAAQ